MASDPKRKEGTDPTATALQQWAEGKATLREVRRYTRQEVYSIARAAHVYFNQGRMEEARTLYQGLYALDPTDSYAARALGVVELACGNLAGALAAYEVAVKLDDQDARAYLGRAEVRVAMGQKQLAAEDARRAAACVGADAALVSRAVQMVELLNHG